MRGSIPRRQSAYSSYALWRRGVGSVGLPDLKKLYRFHVENLREIEKSLKSISLQARTEIRNRDPSQNLRSLVRLYALVMGCWAETRLSKLLYEEGGLDESERSAVLTVPSKFGQWKRLVDLAFRKHHMIGAARIDRVSVGVAQFARYEVLNEVLDKELEIIIQMRNKLAHGQWLYPLNESGTNVSADYYRRIETENLLSLQFKLALLRYLTDIIHDLIVSPATFQRDFDTHYRNLEQQRRNLKNRKYSKYKETLISRQHRYKELTNPKA